MCSLHNVISIIRQQSATRIKISPLSHDNNPSIAFSAFICFIIAIKFIVYYHTSSIIVCSLVMSYIEWMCLCLIVCVSVCAGMQWVKCTSFACNLCRDAAAKKKKRFTRWNKNHFNWNSMKINPSLSLLHWLSTVMPLLSTEYCKNYVQLTASVVYGYRREQTKNATDDSTS